MSRPSIMLSMNVVNSKKRPLKKLKTVVVLDQYSNIDYECIVDSLSTELKILAEDKISLKKFIMTFVKEGYEEYIEKYMERVILEEQKYGKI
jgi:hypothetical protein